MKMVGAFARKFLFRRSQNTLPTPSTDRCALPRPSNPHPAVGGKSAVHLLGDTSGRWAKREYSAEALATESTPHDSSDTGETDYYVTRAQPPGMVTYGDNLAAIT